MKKQGELASSERPQLGNQLEQPAFDWSSQPQGIPMPSFVRRLIFHYGIYRRYPLRPLPALRNAWRIARA